MIAKQRIDAHHIFPEKAIKEPQGYKLLTDEQKYPVRNFLSNFQVLPSLLNASKGANAGNDWLTIEVNQPILLIVLGCNKLRINTRQRSSSSSRIIGTIENENATMS